MAGQHGGHRTPSNPAPASGPGRLSKRTDGGPGQKLQAPTGMEYGGQKALLEQERTAAMSQADSTPTVNIPAGAPAGDPAQASGYAGGPFAGPSARPDEPITHGVDIGPGGGSNILPLELQGHQQPVGRTTQMLAQLAARDQTGTLANLYQSALAAGA